MDTTQAQSAKPQPPKQKQSFWQWLKGRALSRRQLHNADDPANQLFDALAGQVEAKAEEAVAGAVAQEVSKL